MAGAEEGPDGDLVLVPGGSPYQSIEDFVSAYEQASGTGVDRAQANEKISFVTNAVVEEVLGDTSVTGVRLRDTRTGEIFEQMILPSLRGGGYLSSRQVHIGARLGGEAPERAHDVGQPHAVRIQHRRN